MKKLDTSACSSTNILYTKSGTFDFLQLAHQETAEAIMRNIVGVNYDPTKGYVLYGCTTTSGPGGSTIVLAGAIFFNGEIYLSPQQTVPALSVGQVIITNILPTPYTTNADPTDFSDGTPRNVHNNRTASHVGGTSGSGAISDFSDLIRLQPTWAGIDFSGTYWIDAGAPNVARYAKNRDFVMLEGAAQYNLGTSSSAGTLFTLPAGFRPSQDVNFVCPNINLTATPEFILVNINSSGVASSAATVSVATKIDLSVIKFRPA